jgi:uncharacterized membrane protein
MATNDIIVGLRIMAAATVFAGLLYVTFPYSLILLSVLAVFAVAAIIGQACRYGR